MTYFVKQTGSSIKHKTKKRLTSCQNQHKITYGEKTISFQGRDYWNKLPNNLKEVTSVALFKRKLKHHILDSNKIDSTPV